ncbi:sulfurtransferase complex subunit TusB [Microbulbifer hydrolyticus]|uniref:Sulfurtransferase complex subunit TusB n=1 Tax=Microbulbifer hydrolyticus TaxID=48074 RepID=A0A6P1TC41_9GAMM|nr:sulfurtransferase complex subunit TusB [Microbulbifer hydrolyticus]MBB5210306.1 tRNA 2-thiouridine synthesizing protein B [Microbulbifer hydrolyticus]QHQ39196.1 sulfurtransferase complex subunit TusB [Microbulbifer hydrolyticus]
MTLHIVNQSPHTGSALRDCLASFAEGDALLLIEDGVYGAAGHQPLPENNVYCLQADADARGITLAANVEGIDDLRWVSLCTEHNPVVSWFK